jgi:hypothetical protein
VSSLGEFPVLNPHGPALVPAEVPVLASQEGFQMNSTFLLLFQEACEEAMQAQATGSKTRTRKTGDQSRMALAAATKTSSREQPDHAHQMGYATFGVGTEPKSRETGDQQRADNALAMGTATATREGEINRALRAYLTFGS